MFFRGLDRFGVKIEDLGTANVEGVACQKIAFIHGPNIVFTRYFETATGRLVLTETEAGGVIRERMERRAGHFMPTTLLDSQLALLERPTADERPIIVEVAGDPEAIVRAILAELGRVP